MYLPHHVHPKGRVRRLVLDQAAIQIAVTTTRASKPAETLYRKGGVRDKVDTVKLVRIPVELPPTTVYRLNAFCAVALSPTEMLAADAVHPAVPILEADLDSVDDVLFDEAAVLTIAVELVQHFGSQAPPFYTRGASLCERGGGAELAPPHPHGSSKAAPCHHGVGLAVDDRTNPIDGERVFPHSAPTDKRMHEFSVHHDVTIETSPRKIHAVPSTTRDNPAEDAETPTTAADQWRVVGAMRVVGP